VSKSSLKSKSVILEDGFRPQASAPFSSIQTSSTTQHWEPHPRRCDIENQ
jgi:hypothetical protein